MNIYIETPQCSQCGSQNNETFQGGNHHGRRCLNCGHEQIVETTTTHREGDPIVWAKSPGPSKF